MDLSKIDRRAFIAKLGGASAIATIPASILADKLEDEMIATLETKEECGPTGQLPGEPPSTIRKGAGIIFNADRVKTLKPLPKKPTLLDFYESRFTDGLIRHCLRTAENALKSGQDEIHIMAALVHDTVQALIRADHGYWGADFVAPYVDERVAWGIKYHQVCRFFPDESVGYTYPESYKRMFGENFTPEPYAQHDYKYARKHKWYMHARLITLNDQYGFGENEPNLDDFVDIIGRNFKQPKEGLGYDNSPSAHMWRALINPNRPL